MANNRTFLIALQRFETGGAERQALYLAEGLLARGYRVVALAFGAEGGVMVDRWQKAGITCTFTGFHERVLLDLGPGLKKWLLRWRYKHRLIGMVRERKVDVILPFTYAPNVIYGMLWTRMNAEVCCWNQRDEGRLFLGRTWEIRALKNCSHILSNSLEGQTFLKRFTELPIQIIHNGVTIQANTTMPANPVERSRVVMVANIHSYKDHATLLRAWKLVVDHYREPVQLILAGKELDVGPQLRKYVSEANLQDSVLFAGLVQDVPSLLRTCQVAVFSSVKEGLPNGILESMAVGLPVVATRINGSVEALGENCSYLATPGNEMEMAEMILLLLRNPSLREQEGRRNRERIVNNFGIERMVERYLAVLTM